MTPDARRKLHLIVNFVAEQRQMEKPAMETIATLMRAHGATYDTSGSANVLRCAGVTGSSTCENKGAAPLTSWLRLAQRKLEREE